MYGYESGSSGGLGGLIARAQPNQYTAADLTIMDPGAMIIGDNTAIPGVGSVSSPGFLLGPGMGGVPSVSLGGGAVTQPMSTQVSSWRQILDFHNSPAPWVLLMILLVYGYVHVSYAKGRVRAGGGL